MGNLAARIVQDFTVVVCAHCQSQFAVPEHVEQRWRENGNTFYCPYGRDHNQSYGNGEKEKLKKKLAQAKKQLEWAQTDIDNAHADNEHLRNTVRAEKGAKTKLKKRIANGVCPCCNRSFVNVKRHMDSQHPEYGNK